MLKAALRAWAPWLLAGLAALGAGWAWDRRASLDVSARVPLGAAQRTFQGRDGKPWDLPGLAVELSRVRAQPGPKAFQLHALPDPDAPRGAEAERFDVREGDTLKLASGLKVEVERLLPDAVDVGDLQEEPGPEDPALRLMVGLGEPAPLVGTLFSRRPDSRRLDEPGGRFALLYLDAWDPALPGALPTGGGGPRLRVVAHGRTLEGAARVGTTLDLPGSRLEVTRDFPDFEVRPGPDGAPQPGSRSARPFEPWLEVRLTRGTEPPRTLLLSARQPDLTDRLNAPNLPAGVKVRYLRPSAGGPPRWVVFTREDGRIRLVERGAVARTEPLAQGRPFVVLPGCSVTPLFQLRRAVHQADWVPAPQATGAFENPVLRVRVVDPATGQAERAWLAARGSDGAPDLHTFLNGRVALAYQARPLQAEDLRADLVLRDGEGREVARGEATVDHPLAHGDLRFGLAPEGAQEVGAVGLRLRTFPGRWLRWAGGLLIAAGLGWAFLRIRVPITA